MRSAYSHREVFLRPEVKMEPLVSGWHAWIHLISPIQHAMNVANRQLPLLDSFIRNPGVHAAACSDPAMFGGPFVELSAEQLPEIQKFFEQLQDRHSRLIALAHDLKRLDRLLQEQAKGYALDEFYPQIPESLSGLVEFLYDINNHPRLRFHEALVYDEYFETSGQQISLSLADEERRPFFMTTPRLCAPGRLTLSISFADQRLDRLASMRTAPASLDGIAQELELDDAQREQFEKLFTTESPAKRVPVVDDGKVTMRYFGHACVLVQSAHSSVLIDPMLSWENHRQDGRFTCHDLPDRLDFVILSHAHHDHFSPEVLIQLRSRIDRIVVPANNSGSVTDPSMELALRRLGFERIDVLNGLDEIRFKDGVITSLPFTGEHCDLDIHSRQAVHLEISGRRFAFFADSNGMDSVQYRRIARRLGRRLDGLFIGMECRGGPLSWLYSPLLTKPISRKNDESRRLSGLDSERAWRVLQEFEADHVFVYAMGQEPWLRFIMGLEYTPESVQKKEISALLDRCAGADIHAECLYLSREMTF
ncbi:MAG TPA: MBL fold metallo-hydrolase [Steroidobacteraceae bacterium]|nr:MBL fold metallo-hydrolase [Steroidobacteraceae bacterium]